ncbi:hypothetical protein [Paenibacillus solani]|nr:hypothetical protein [Paenibacillus solani]
MKLYPQMFISPWHLIVIVLALIAFIGLRIGGYDRKTVLRSTGLSTLAFYFFLTIPIGLITQDSLYKEETMLTHLDQNYEEKKADGELRSIGDYITVHAGAYRRKDKADIEVYAGNYHESQTFQGNITLFLYDKNDDEVFTEMYENITLAPGEKKKLDSTFTSQPMETYRYRYKTHPQM